MSLRSSLAALLAWSLTAGPVFAAPLRAPSVEPPSSAIEAPTAASAASAADMSAAGAPQASVQTAALGAALAPAGQPTGASAQAAPAFDEAFDGASARVRGFLDDLRLPFVKERFTGESYVLPNEKHPEHARAILTEATPGAYVAVGTERGFIGASLAASSHLLLVDRDQAVVAYNRANAALLRLAKDRPEHVKLRTAGAAAIRRLARRRGFTQAERDTLTDDLTVFAPLQTSNLLMHGDGQYFEGANYLKDDALFARLKALADARRIRPVRLDLKTEEGSTTLAGALAGSGVRLAVLDVSNAWWDRYLGHGRFSRLVAALARSADERSIVLMTGWERAKGWDWAYYGFRPYSGGAGAVAAADMTGTAAQLDRYVPDRLGTVGAPPPMTRRQRLARIWRRIFG